MVRLEWSDIVAIIAIALAVWCLQKKWTAEARSAKREAKMKKENARLRDLTAAQDEALRKISSINRKLIEDKPIVIIREARRNVNTRV